MVFWNVDFLFETYFIGHLSLNSVTSFVLDWKSRAVCDSLIAYNRSDQACAKTACLCRRARKSKCFLS